MSFSRDGIGIRLQFLWVGTWILWLVSGAFLPIPPWRAAATLQREEALALRQAANPALIPWWSIALGDARQQEALGPGWGPPEGKLGSRQRRSVLRAAALRFHSPAWPEATVTLQAGQLSTGSVDVSVMLDGRPRGSLKLNQSWAVASLPVGGLTEGTHLLSLESAPEGIPLAGVAVGTAAVAEPAHNSGFLQWVAVGGDERPAIFPSSPWTAPPEGAARVETRGLRGWYGFGTGPRVGRGAAVLEVAHGLISAALLTVVTGLGYAALCASQGAARLILAPMFSAGVLMTVFALLRILDQAPTPLATAMGLAGLGALPLLRIRRDETARLPWRLLLPSGLALAVLCFFALRVVPPLDDQDLEVQGTAWALAHRGVPAMITDRGTTYFFAHPPLLHLWVSGSFALAGRLDRVADADALARLAEAKGPFVEPRAGEYPPPHYHLWRQLLERFFVEPQLWPTRQINVVLAALSVAWVAHLGAALSGHSIVGVGVALVLASFPEFLVRGAYGGYFAITTVTVLGAVAALEPRADWRAAAASAVAVLSNQKGLLVPVAWMLAAPRFERLGRFLPALGAALGLGAFVVWGLAIDAPTFVYDFLKMHVFHRLALSDVRLIHEAGSWYPSIPELWREFVRHYGLAFTCLAALASLRALRSDSAYVRVCGFAVVVGALVFSLTDWRQTKHLALLAAPALLAVAAACPAAPRARAVFLTVLVMLIANNLWTAWPLVSDFLALRPSTIW